MSRFPENAAGPKVKIQYYVHPEVAATIKRESLARKIAGGRVIDERFTTTQSMKPAYQKPVLETRVVKVDSQERPASDQYLDENGNINF